MLTRVLTLFAALIAGAAHGQETPKVVPAPAVPNPELVATPKVVPAPAVPNPALVTANLRKPTPPSMNTSASPIQKSSEAAQKEATAEVPGTLKEGAALPSLVESPKKTKVNSVKEIPPAKVLSNVQGAPPALPAVDSILSSASNTLEDFASQAKLMQSRVLQQQASSRAMLAEEKKRYEANLTQDVALINATKLENAKLQRRNERWQSENEAAMKEAAELQESTEIMRTALTSLGEKMDLAKSFILVSVNATDDSNAAELSVMRPTTQAPTLEHFLDVARAEIGLNGTDSSLADAAAPLFLQLTARTQRRAKKIVLPDDDESPEAAAERRMKDGTATPADLVPLLSRSLERIAKAEHAGKDAMKEKFEAKHNVNKMRYEELMKDQAKLEKEGSELKKKKELMLQANNMLMEVRSNLFQRLHGFQVFALKVDEAMAETLRAADAMVQ